ncbi:hypothetical protein SAMN04515665_109155 [Blastococcus sp. DSM 46786]|uniref:hypothetical protein n=1 Tax=Blastococcus sp. DSM 46786 TaxID=1798227 RepID=UPI0008B53B37|nr:hypothetical protein [Blastococcus sp. DSM 46786]SEL21203.1 hypothetical protein SAMN04515665_109155 [Blastococcus sp. DSM 46786]
MASTVLDVRGTVGSSSLRPERVAPEVPASGALRRIPAPALAAGVLSVLEAVGLLALGLARADVVLASPVRPPGWVVAVSLLLLAGWIVLTAGAGAALLDGSTRTLLVLTSVVELAAVSVLGGSAVLLPLPTALTGGLPLPLLFAAAFALPIGKLLLVDAPSARAWVLQGPRVREHRPDPVVVHRSLCALTLGCIALLLGGFAVLNPVGGDPVGPVAGVVSQP